MSAGIVESRIRSWAEKRRLPKAHLGRWLALAHEDRVALLETAERLRLRTGQFVTALELLDEIALRDRESIAGVLARNEIRRILEGTGSAPGRAQSLVEQLRVACFPRLKRTIDRLRTEIAALALPPGIRVVLPVDLSSDELRIEIRASGGAELERLIGAIDRHAAGLRRIAEMLGGADEV